MKMFFFTILALTVSSSAQAYPPMQMQMTCTIQSGSISQNVALNSDESSPQIEVGGGQYVEITLFADDIRIGLHRAPTLAERQKFQKENGRNEIGLDSIVIAYTQTEIKGGRVSLAQLLTPKVSVLCKAKPSIQLERK